MKTLKNVTLFLAGSVTFWGLLSVAMTRNTIYPREGTVIYEDDEMKVIRMTPEKNKTVDVATILYKKNQ